MSPKKLSLVLASLMTGAILQTPVEAASIKHVVLISIDGFHENDLEWFVGSYPNSTMATLVKQGVHYTNAQTPFPSDSFPGMVGMVTGGNPSSTGIYYDDAYSRDLLPCGCNSLSITTSGAEVGLFENLDLDFGGDGSTLTLDAGQGIKGLYPVQPLSAYSNPNQHPIFQLTGNATSLIDPSQLAKDPATGSRVYPHSYIKVNTIFEIAKQKGLHTAWSDKHPAYEILNGPSGTGVDDLFAPEINSITNNPSTYADWTKDDTLTVEYDAFKVQAVLNWAQGYDHAGNGNPGIPAIYGMNFQTVSVAQKLNTSLIPGSSSTVTSVGGYDFSSGSPVPGPVLTAALQSVDAQLGRIKSQLGPNDAFILTAKHGQSPQNRADLTIINDGNMIAALDAAWNSVTGGTDGLVDHAMDDDGVLLWLKVHTQEADDFAAGFLMNYSGTGIGSDANGNKTSKSFSNAGLQTVYAGTQAAQFMNVKTEDGRYPDVIGIAKVGSVYAGSKLSKIAEHGGDASNDRHVPIVIWRGDKSVGKTVASNVSTVQVAPTILKLLGLNPNSLQAVKLEKTKLLPGS